MVKTIANDFGLRRAPETHMIDARVSPMVCLGWRVRLILPTPLWDQLDDVSRRAVVCHELAHVRRRDHWVYWLQIGMSALFWWHPLLWWVRRRISEEAEMCCDAWVTWLYPKNRRAYAQALLTTKEFIGVGWLFDACKWNWCCVGSSETFCKEIENGDDQK